jgi:adenylate cyclase class IV
MAGRKLTDEKRKLRVDLVEALGEFIKSNADAYEQDEVAELVAQTQRVAKFLGVVNAADQ